MKIKEALKMVIFHYLHNLNFWYLGTHLTNCNHDKDV